MNNEIKAVEAAGIDLPEPGQQLTIEQKHKLMEAQVSRLVSSFNRQQRRAFASVFSRTRSFEKAIRAAASRGWRGQFVAPSEKKKVPNA